jgi:[ribosomal protein S5]-alanine N-acetyltransferase
MAPARLLPERLRTPRLVLRAPRATDAQPLFEHYMRDSTVTQYTVWRPHFAITQTQEFVQRCIPAWSEGTSRPYVLTLADDEDAPIGMLEARPRSHTVDLGYGLARAQWGNALMSEAVRNVTEACLNAETIFRVQATCDADNLASARSLENAGFRCEGRLERSMVLPQLSAEPRAFLMYARCK